jgi:hypothetical protein
VFEAISNIEHNKAPGPDEFPAEFNSVIKDDMMAMFVQLKDVDLPLYKLYFGLMTLLPYLRRRMRAELYST